LDKIADLKAPNGEDCRLIQMHDHAGVLADPWGVLTSLLFSVSGPKYTLLCANFGIYQNFPYELKVILITCQSLADILLFTRYRPGHWTMLSFNAIYLI